MKTGTIRLGLSLLVAMTFWVNRVPAQDIMHAPGGEHILVVPTVPYEPALIYPGPSPFVKGPPPWLAKHRLQQLSNQAGVCCESNSPWGACGNFHYDFYFIFGSCRSFFGEPCVPAQHGHHANRTYWAR